MVIHCISTTTRPLAAIIAATALCACSLFTLTATAAVLLLRRHLRLHLEEVTIKIVTMTEIILSLIAVAWTLVTLTLACNDDQASDYAKVLDLAGLTLCCIRAIAESAFLGLSYNAVSHARQGSYTSSELETSPKIVNKSILTRKRPLSPWPRLSSFPTAPQSKGKLPTPPFGDSRTRLLQQPSVQSFSSVTHAPDPDSSTKPLPCLPADTHIHPLFRASPVPPPVASPDTSITGHAVPEWTVSRKHTLRTMQSAEHVGRSRVKANMPPPMHPGMVRKA